jgi:polysaccharide biosynthesis protein PslG
MKGIQMNFDDAVLSRLRPAGPGPSGNRSAFAFRSILLFLFFSSACINCAKDTPASPAVQESSDFLPGPVIPESLGFNLHITGPERDLNRIRESGIRIVRKDLFWDSVEKVKGQFAFGEYDRLLQGLEQRGIRVLFILCYGNALYPRPEDTEEGREAYARFAAEAARHYKGRNILWEIWNEPNVMHFWKGPGDHNSVEFADQYVTLVKKTVPAMRGADPGCFIAGGSVSCLWVNSFRWIDRCLKQGLLKTGINCLSVHPYGFSRPELAVDEGYGHLRAMLAQAGEPDFPVLNTEVGYNADEAYLGRADLRLEHQAWHFVRQYLVDLMCGIRMTIWYNWNDDHGFRLVNDDMSSLPVFTACSTMTRSLSGYAYHERLETDSKRDFVLVFKKALSLTKLVCWTTPRNRDDAPETAGRHDVVIPAGVAADSVRVHDLYGNYRSAAVTEGKITLSLTGSPLTVELEDAGH